MLHWNKNPNRHFVTQVDTLSDCPNGGKVKLSILGILLPCYIIYHAVIAWVNELATWYGRNSDMEVIGNTARSLAVAYASVAIFCHVRWFWGVLGRYRVWELGTILSLLGFLGGLVMAVVFEFFIG